MLLLLVSGSQPTASGITPTVTVTCNSAPVVVGTRAACSAAVTGSPTPTGIITWSSSGGSTAGSTISVGNGPWATTFAPSNNAVYVSNYYEGTVSVIDASTNTVVKTITVGYHPRAFAFAPSNNDVYVTNLDGEMVSVIDTATNTVVKNITVYHGPWVITFAPSNNDMYVGNWDGTVTVIDTLTNAVVGTITVGTGPFGITFAPSNNDVYVANYHSGTVSVIDTSSNAVVETIPVGGGLSGIAFNPSNSDLYLTNYYDNTVSVLDTATNRIVGTIGVGSHPSAIALTSSNNHVYAANYADNTVSVISTSTNKVVENITVGSNPTAITFAPSNNDVYVVNYGDNTVSVLGPSPIAFSSDTCTLADGHCSVSLTGSLFGEATIKATYYGDSNNLASTGSLGVTVSSFAVTCTKSSQVVGSSNTCKAVVPGSSPTGTITWSAKGPGQFSPSSCRLSKGSCTVKYTPTSVSTVGSLWGSYRMITANYSGDGNNQPSFGAYALTVTLKPSKVSVACKLSSVPARSSTTCTATVSGYLPGGAVTWSKTGTGSVSFSSNTCTLVKGRCSVNLSGTISGTVTVQAAYGGDPNNTGSAGARNLTIR
jgi:YVTN family beta-propeller protein